MRKLMNKAQMEMVKVMIKGRAVLEGNSGEGMVDSAVFPVQDDYDRMNTIQKIKYQIISEKFKLINNLSILLRRTKVILADQRGQTALDQVVFSVLRCYDRIATLRKRVNNKMNRVRFRVNELMNRSKVVLLDRLR